MTESKQSSEDERKKEYLAALMEAVEANNLSSMDLRAICLKPERTVFYWLSQQRAPDDHAMLMIYHALLFAGKNVPRALGRIAQRNEYGMRKWVKKNKTKNKPKPIGKKVGMKQRASTYIYQGRLMIIADIAKMAGKRPHTIYARIVKSAKRKAGEDVTDLVDRPVQRKSKSA